MRNDGGFKLRTSWAYTTNDENSDWVYIMNDENSKKGGVILSEPVARKKRKPKEFVDVDYSDVEEAKQE